MIQTGDIKLVASQVMDDVPEGGGRATGTAIIDGASNSIFTDISELDRAYGRVNLRKVSVSVVTNDTDGYYGANVIIAKPPMDSRVSVTLFSTKDGFDRRTDAQSRLESYLVPGPEWPGFLLENHVAGQRVIQLFQRPAEAAPNIGETIVLVSKEGAGDQVIQYVRVIGVSIVVREYTKANGQPYTAAVVSCEISDPLRTDFPGSPPSEFFARATLGAKVRETSVADAAVYAGVVPLIAPAAIGDLQLSASSIFTQLVPSAQTEIPIVDANVAGQSTTLSESANGNVSYTTVVPFTTSSALSLGNAVTPGTLVITTTSGDLTDTGGQLFAGSVAVGSVDYGRGTVTFQGIPATYTGSKTVTFKPATAPLRVSDTGQIPVTIESRAYNYVISLMPMPAPGSVRVSYRAQGRWYDLRDNGSGTLRGVDTAFGVGSVNYATGTVLVTLGALPDVGSGIMLVWNTQANYINRSDMPVTSAGVRFSLPLVLTEPDPEELEPGKVVITWNDGTPRTATDNGLGALTGDGTGKINYKTGVAEMYPVLMPAGGQGYSVAYAKAAPVVKYTTTTPDPARNPDTTITIDLGVTNIKPGTLRLSMPLALDSYREVDGGGSLEMHISQVGAIVISDNGSGRIIAALGRDAGSINYATGIIIFQPDGLVITKILTYVRYFGVGYGLMLGAVV
ncbi:MAG: hypothetical protein GZ090_01390 [Oxalobacteraceae bacterium]|nr:hypothetical protein [Oxalobacteraceae bacterium]